MVFLLLVAGLACLLAGAECLVRGASRLALALGISPLVIGLTVVAFGTSAPELAVSVRGALAGQPEVAVGNAVGSNTFNILFILGLSALITPLAVAQKLVRVEVPLMIGVSAVTFLLSLDGSIARGEGVLLFTGIVLYVAAAVRQSLRERERSVKDEYRQAFGGDAGGPGPAASLALQIILVLVGLGLLVLGARWLVDGAVAIAEALGVDKRVIALTVVAAGTSLPEVATSVVAGIRGQRDIAVGNVVGSNIFNLLAVLGLSAAVAPDGVAVAAATLRFDMPVMLAASVACLPVFFTGHRIARWEGAVFLLYYVVWTTYLVLDTLGHGGLGPLHVATGFFVVPLTAIALGVSVVRSVRSKTANRT